MDVVGIGTACVDLLASIDQLPRATDQGTRVKDFSWQGGGKVATALVAAARLGASAGFIGVVGDCEFGRFCIRDFQRHGVDTSRMLVDEGARTPFSMVLAEAETQGRNIMYYPGTVRRVSVEDLDREYLVSGRCLHLENDSTASRLAAKWAKEAGITVFFDADGYHEGIEDMLPLIDVFIASEFYYKDRYGSGSVEAGLRDIIAKGSKVAVFTLGKEGSVAMEGENFYRAPGYRVNAVDTTGAGDVYHGAFIFGMLKGWDVPYTARFANAVSAIKCTRLGGRAGIPDLATALKFMEEGVIDYSEIDERVQFYSKWGV